MPKENNFTTCQISRVCEIKSDEHFCVEKILAQKHHNMLLEILHDLHFCVESMQTKITSKNFLLGRTFLKYDFLDFLLSVNVLE